MSSSKSKVFNSTHQSEEATDSPMLDISDDEMEEKETSKSACGVILTGYKPHPTKMPRDGRRYIIRKSKRRATYWADFTEYLDNNNHLRAECNFCETATFAANSVINGSKNISRHWFSCSKNPANKSKGKQSHLAFDPLSSDHEVKLSYKEVTAEDVRKALVFMIIIDELPYRFVEKPGFRYFMSVVMHALKVPSRSTITRDCYQFYLDERASLKALLKKSCQRICVTTDTWTSSQKINYMCLTGHFIDDTWILQKRILNFCPISSHKGEAIGKAVEDCLNTWDLEGKLFTVTVDNASSNDTACAYLKKVVKKNGGISDGKHLHMRCIAHIVNLIVWDGLEDHGKYIDKIRSAIKYVNNSPARIRLFREQVEKCKIDCKLELTLDVCTRWNSTYDMLDRALKYRDVFGRVTLPIDLLEPEYLGPLSDDEWDKLERLVTFLKEFYDLTNRISGSLFVTSNALFFQIGHTHGLLNDWLNNEDPEFQNMAVKMKQKYDKYWGELEKMNMLIYLAVILDPNFKFLGVSIALCDMYKEKGPMLAEKVKKFAYDIFDEYRRIYSPVTGDNGEPSELSANRSGSSRTSLRYMSNIQEQVKKQMSGSNRLVRSEFDRYLNEEKGDDEEKNILLWWKANAHRYHVLSHMARDVLAIPISTVASESAFSSGGRTLDSFRSSLTPKMVQAQVCGQDWIRASLRQEKLNMEENLEELEKLGKEFEKMKVEDDTIFVS